MNIARPRTGQTAIASVLGAFLTSSLALGLAVTGCQALTGCQGSTPAPRADEPEPAPAAGAAVSLEEGAPGPLTVAFAQPCPRAGCELVLGFSRPMVRAPRTGMGPVKVKLTPPQAGRWKWRSPTELVFAPGPSAMRWGHQVEIAVPVSRPLEGEPMAKPWSMTLQIPYFEAAGKVARWPVIDGRPRAIAFLTDGWSHQIGDGPIFLLYDQPVDPRRIAKHVRLSHDRDKLPVTVTRPTSISHLWRGEVDLTHLVAISASKLPGDGETVKVQYPRTLDGDVPEVGFRDYSVDRTFRLIEARPVGIADGASRARVPTEASWDVQFDNPISAERLTAALELERVGAPKAAESPKAEVRWVWGNEARVHATLEPGAAYKLTISPDLHDNLGNRLGVAHTITFKAHDLPPVLAVPDEPLALERGHAEVPIRVTNVGGVTAAMYPVASPREYIALLRAKAPGCAGSPARTWAVAVNAQLNAPAPHAVAIASPAKPHQLACLSLRAAGRGSQAPDGNLDRALPIQVTGLGVTAKVHEGGVMTWVTTLADASPVAGAVVVIADEHGAELARATTDSDGIARLAPKGVTKRGGLVRDAYMIVETASDVAVAPLAEGTLAQPWQFDLRGDVADVAALPAAVFTERGVYRPGETVHVKAIVRNADGTRAATGPLSVTVTDPRGDALVKRELSLDAFGAAATEVALPEGAPTGSYSLAVSQGDRTTSRAFRVAEYRVPTFEVEVTSDQASWQLASAPARKSARKSPTGKAVRGADTAARATITARYLHGGELAARPVKFTVAREPARFSPRGFGGYAFARPDTEVKAGVVTRGERRLNGQGVLAVEFQPRHPPAAGPMRYTVEASVTDVDRQVYAGRLSRVVHPTAFYLGVRPPPQRVLAAGDVLEVPTLAVAPAGRVVSGVRTQVALQRIDHHTTTRMAGDAVERHNRPVIKTVSRCARTTERRAVTCKLRIPRAGQYRVVASAVDAAGRPVETGFEFAAGGEHTVAWPRFVHERIELTTDKPSYQPGDVARLMVQTPFAKARGLLTLERLSDRAGERGGAATSVIEHRLFEIDGDAPVIEIPITADHAPNVYASVSLIRGRVHEGRDATGFETGAPSFRLGYAELRVAPTPHALNVAVVPAAGTAHPGSRLTVDIAVTDAAGAPAAGQATVMVVDEAVLGMSGYRTPDPLAEIFRPRALGVRTASSVLDLPGARRARHEQIVPAGDGGPGFGLTELAPDLRHLFKATAFYDADVRVGTDGRARVSFDLPDNTTTYRVMAVVTGAGAGAGAGDAQVEVKKPLMVAAVAPRFVYPGDELQVEALVYNGTGEPGRARVAAALSGVTTTSADPARVELAPGAVSTVKFPVSVTGRGDAVLRFTAQMGAYSDAVEVKVPILDPGVRRRQIVRQAITTSGELSVDLPADRLPGTASLEVMVSATRLTELKESVEYVMGYPNGCIEQTTSRAYPLLVLEDLLPEMGVTVDPGELKKYAEAGVKRLLSFQTSAGGLSYWPGSDEPHAFGTAFGLSALIEAKARGYQVPDAALAKMAAYLEQNLSRGKISEEMPHGGIADADTRALFVMTLGRLGRPQPGYISTLWRERKALTAFGLAFLAVAAHEHDASDGRVEAMLAAVREKSIEEAQQAYFKGDRDGGWSMGSPLRTHAGALLAFAKVAPGNEMRQKLLAGLLGRQQGGQWGNTQENVFGIMGVAEAIRRVGGNAAKRGNGENGADAMPQVAVAVNGTEVAADAMIAVGSGGVRVRLPHTQLAGSSASAKPGPARQVVRVANRGAGAVHATVRAEYELALTEATRRPTSHGFAVTRRYETPEGAPVAPGAVKLGQTVHVIVRVVADAQQNYVAVADHLPAGLEPLDTDLATTERVSAGKLTAPLARGLAALSYSEIRDARVAFYADDLPAGTYEFAYLARATTPGTFLRPAATAEAMYQPDASGTSSIDAVTIR